MEFGVKKIVVYIEAFQNYLTRNSLDILAFADNYRSCECHTLTTSNSLRGGISKSIFVPVLRDCIMSPCQDDIFHNSSELIKYGWNKCR